MSIQNGPAFPTEGGSTGMSLYEYIAIEAMKSAIANPEYVRLTPEKIAKFACTMAYTMMKEFDQ